MLVVKVLLEWLVIDLFVIDRRQRIDVFGLEGGDRVAVCIVLDAHGLLIVEAAVTAPARVGILFEPSANGKNCQFGRWDLYYGSNDKRIMIPDL